MGRRKNRSRSTISQLPPEVRDVVDEMVKATNTCTLADIQKYLASLDVTLSCRQSAPTAESCWPRWRISV